MRRHFFRGGAGDRGLRERGAAMCSFESMVMNSNCAHDVRFDCACASGAWQCDLHALDHHVCPLPDGGFD